MASIKWPYKVIRNKKGQTIIEFALIAIILFGLIFLIVDLGIMLFVNLSMQHAVREGTRYAITGRSDLSPSGQRASIIQQITNKSVGIYPKYCSTPNFYVWSGTSATFISGTCSNNPGQSCAGDADCTPPGTCNFPSNVGAPTDVIVISVDCSWPLLTPFLKKAFNNGTYSFTVKATMRNEPFPATGGS
jgi:Flp pilus assembly protein TadG